MQDLHGSGQIKRAITGSRQVGHIERRRVHMRNRISTRLDGPSARDWLARSESEIQLVVISGSYADQ